MDTSLAAEIDRMAQEIDRLTREGDPEGRLPDLHAYLRVLSTRLAMALPKDPGRWG